MRVEQHGADDTNEFIRRADGRATGFFAEYWYFVRNNKKWWMFPVFVVLLLLGTLVILGATSAAPFIYTLF
jgi:hypothetical protein